jgi:hypothetical protein
LIQSKHCSRTYIGDVTRSGSSYLGDPNIYKNSKDKKLIVVRKCISIFSVPYIR